MPKSNHRITTSEHRRVLTATLAAPLLAFALVTLFPSSSRAGHSVADHYGWQQLGSGWYLSNTLGAIFLVTPTPEGAWGWSDSQEAWMFFSVSGTGTPPQNIFYDPWGILVPTYDPWNDSYWDHGQHARGSFPRLYLSDYIDEVQTAIDSGVLLYGMPEGYSAIVAALDLTPASAQARAYLSILNTGVWANAEAARIISNSFWYPADDDIGASRDALTGLSQAIDQSVTGITQALAQAISQGTAEPHHIGAVTRDYARAYQLLTTHILQLTAENDLSLSQAFAQSLTGMSQALAQGYLGTTQSLSQGYAGLQAARQSGIPQATLTSLETKFRVLTDSYTFNYAAEAASLAASISDLLGQAFMPDSFLAFTQAIAQNHVGTTQAMAQSYLGVTQALFQTVNTEMDRSACRISCVALPPVTPPE